MFKKLGIEEFQDDIKQKQFDKVMDVIENKSMDLIQTIIKEKNIELSLENNADKETKYYAIIRCFDGNNAYFESVLALMDMFLDWYSDNELKLYDKKSMVTISVRLYNRVLSSFEKYQKTKEQIGEKGYDVLKQQKIDRLIQLFKEMLTYKKVGYEDDWDFSKWIEVMDCKYHFYHEEFVNILDAVSTGSITKNFEDSRYDSIDVDCVEVILMLDSFYDLLTYKDGDYKEFANYYRDFELRDGETYQDLYDREKEKLRKLFMEMLDFLDVSYPSDDFDSLTSLIREHYPYYFDTMVSLKVTLADSKSTYIVELNDMEDIYESFSKNYKRHDEFMKQYYDEGKDFLDDDIEFIDE